MLYNGSFIFLDNFITTKGLVNLAECISRNFILDHISIWALKGNSIEQDLIDRIGDFNYR